MGGANRTLNSMGGSLHQVGVDIICASGTEGGAHTGDVSTLVLVPQCADMCKVTIRPG